MSVEATTWALHQQAVTDPGARAVLFGLANHANHEGRHAFPSVDLLRRYTGLGRRTVIAKLKLLQQEGLIRKGNQRVAAAIIERADRRPTVYDLALGKGLDNLEPLGDEQAPDMLVEPGADSAPREEAADRGAADAPRPDPRDAQPAPRDGNGVQMTTPRGAGAAPEPSGTNPHSLSGAGDEHPMFGQAAGRDDDGAPPPSQPRRFPMTLGWQPDPEQLAMAFQRAGLPADTRPARHQLAKFTAHHADAGREHGTAAWHAKLADWLRNDLRAAPTGGNADDRTTADRPRHDRAEREAVRQQLADPWDTSWADGLWPDDDAEPGPQGGDHVAGGAGVHPAGGDLPADLEQCIPQRGPAQSGAPRAGGGDGPVAGTADAAGGRADDERAEAVGEYLAADDPGAGLDAGAQPGGLRYAGDW